MSPDRVKWSVLDLIDLPPSQRGILLHLSRQGPADAETLARELRRDLVQVQDALAALLQQGQVRQASDSQWEIALGHVTRHTTLPAKIWPAMLATDRLYSEQEIATLRTAVPLLQFARAKLSEFTDHGPSHGLRVKSFATQLSYILDLTPAERHLLRAGALFHDIGNVVDRKRHNVISQETVEKLAAAGKLPFTAKEAELVGLLCRWHRGEYDPSRTDSLRHEPIRTGLLAAILRVSDAMDIDHRRSDYRDKFRQVIGFFFPDSVPHWTGLEQILGVRIHCNPAVSLQVFARGHATDNLQIDMLRGDMASTLLDWSVMEIDVDSVPARGHAQETADSNALLVFPFEAHSLVMAALSRKHLTKAGYAVELFCYPDTAGGPRWLWGEALPEVKAGNLDRLVIIGDRPDATLSSHLLDTVRRWRATGVTVSVLNRYEANWSRLYPLLELGVELILGGDWAYFWGNAASQADLVWGRCAALCTRDPTQSTVGVTAQEQALTQGLLNVVYKAMVEPPADDTDGWRAVAEPILDRIAANDQAYFARQARDFAKEYARTAPTGRVQGRVAVFEQASEATPQAYYWRLETTIEAHGRVPERGIRFNVPYAIAVWPDGDAVELLAISHWREEEAIPVRLLYPSDLGPVPQGNESTIRVRLSPAQAAVVVPALVAACNRASQAAMRAWLPRTIANP